MISGIIKVEESVISRSRRLRLITLTETLIIPDITKTESNDCFEENNDKRIIKHIAVGELDSALGNHALCTQLTDYSLICRLRCFPELTLGF